LIHESFTPFSVPLPLSKCCRLVRPTSCSKQRKIELLSFPQNLLIFRVRLGLSPFSQTFPPFSLLFPSPSPNARFLVFPTSFRSRRLCPPIYFFPLRAAFLKLSYSPSLFCCSRCWSVFTPAPAQISVAFLPRKGRFTSFPVAFHGLHVSACGLPSVSCAGPSFPLLFSPYAPLPTFLLGFFHLINAGLFFAPQKSPWAYQVPLLTLLPEVHAQIFIVCSPSTFPSMAYWLPFPGSSCRQHYRGLFLPCKVTFISKHACQTVLDL